MQTGQNNRFPKQPTSARVSRRLLDVQVEEEISLKLQALQAHIELKNKHIFIVYSTLLNVINGLRVYHELRKVRKSPTVQQEGILQSPLSPSLPSQR